MKLFLVDHVFPLSTDYAHDAHFRECSERIAELILSHISEDPALFGMRQVDERSEAPVSSDACYSDVETVRIADKEVLRSILRQCGDPSSGKWMLIRSLVTCRAVRYGFDGQAFVCLPTEAPAIVSPDETLIVVQDCSDQLVATDWMDGFIDC